MGKPLTERQAAVLGFIKESIRERGYAPTLREIGAFAGIRSTNGVNDHLRALERKGYIDRDDNRARALRVLDEEVVVLPPKPPIAPVIPPGPRVYFIQSLRTTLIKIGFTSNLAERVVGVRGIVGPTVVLGSIAGGPLTEARLHARFNALHVGREWFRPGRELVDAIAIVLAAENDAAARVALGMEPVPENDEPTPHHCGACGNEGHNARTCPNQLGTPEMIQ